MGVINTNWNRKNASKLIEKTMDDAGVLTDNDKDDIIGMAINIPKVDADGILYFEKVVVANDVKY